MSGGGVPPGSAGGAHFAESEDSNDDSNKDGSIKGGFGDVNGSGGSDAESIWSPDIEQSFQEALAIYPPCGRRKIILSDEGKMYGRNELIARYIKLRTGKTRTRKQVSSHMQVLARRKGREIQSKLKDQNAKEAALQSISSMSSAQVCSIFYASPEHVKDKSLQSLSPQLLALQNNKAHFAPTTHSGITPLNINQPMTTYWPHATPNEDIKPFNPNIHTNGNNNVQRRFYDHCPIASHKLRLVEFAAFIERHENDPDKHFFLHIILNPSTYPEPLETIDIRQIYDKFPEKKGGLKELYENGPKNAFYLVKFWGDLNTSLMDEPGAFYGVTTEFESDQNMTISCSTKVCSFGKQIVEKVETEHARFENGRFVFRIHRSPMCDYVSNFIQKLKSLPRRCMMNAVLENFTILQVISHRETQETLLCVSYVFEVSANECGTQYHIYQLGQS